MGRKPVDDAVKSVVIHMWDLLSRPSLDLKCDSFSLRSTTTKRHAISVLSGISEITIRRILKESDTDSELMEDCLDEQPGMEVPDDPGLNSDVTSSGNVNRFLVKPEEYSKITSVQIYAGLIARFFAAKASSGK